VSVKRLHLLSGGIDSTVMLYDQRPAACLAFDYGQAHRKELEFAWWHCMELAIPVELVTIPKLRGSTLTDGAGGFVVPNRNAVLLNIAANMAASMGLAEVSFACTLDDADDFPDCTPYFVQAINETLAAAGCEVAVVAPYINLSKRSVVERGIDLGVNFYRTWSCYAGGDLPCGECKACASRAKAFRL